MARGGKRENAGRKPIWDVNRIRLEIKRHTATWWEQIGQMMTSQDPGERKFALSEFNKLQVKALPQELSGPDGEGLPFAIVIKQHPSDPAPRD